MPSSLYKENGYYSVLREGLNSNNLQDPVNIYKKEGDVMKNVDVFQQKYARFLRCSSNAPGLSDSVLPTCDPTEDGINSLDAAYKNVIYSIDSLNNGVGKIKPESSSGLTNKDYEESKTEMKDTYDEIRDLRKKLDTKLQYLYNEQKNGRESSAAQLDSTIYANTLWTILATCLLYYILVEM
jgi:peptidoglycan hydrolase CwlO-like protein